MARSRKQQKSRRLSRRKYNGGRTRKNLKQMKNQYKKIKGGS
jgi:hypothetical protein|tara:strand:+ start:1192 stop:1317 length:126 start_codon:yes stop_codon:yes gene_type:complete